MLLFWEFEITNLLKQGVYIQNSPLQCRKAICNLHSTIHSVYNHLITKSTAYWHSLTQLLVPICGTWSTPVLGPCWHSSREKPPLVQTGKIFLVFVLGRTSGTFAAAGTPLHSRCSSLCPHDLVWLTLDPTWMGSERVSLSRKEAKTSKKCSDLIQFCYQKVLLRVYFQNWISTTVASGQYQISIRSVSDLYE